MMSKEIKSAMQFLAMNGMKGQIMSTMSPKEFEDELYSAHINDRPARILTPEGPVLFHGVKNLVTSQCVVAKEKSDIKIVNPNDVNMPPGSPPLKLQ